MQVWEEADLRTIATAYEVIEEIQRAKGGDGG